MTYPIVRMKFLAKEKLMYGANESAELDDRDLPRYIRITDLDSEGNLKEETFKSLEWEKANPYLLEKGDILFARSGATVGKAYIHETDEPACYAGYLIKLKVDLKRCLPKFVFYYTQTNKYAAWIAENTIQATIQNVSAEKYANLFLPLPSLKTQEIIIKYLENNVAHIDGLIAKKIRYIKLLEQQRQSIITEAVTKGVNPNVKMKDSGVEWIGEIPGHWKLTKIKYVATLLNGDRGENYPSGNDFVDEGLPFITSHSLNNRYIDELNMKYISEERYNLLRGIKIRKNDIIYCLRGSVGKNALVTRDEGTIASSLMGIRASTNINAEFLSYILNSKMEVWNRSMLTTGSVSDNLSAENVGTYLFTFPDIDEQMEIVDYLNNEMLKLERLVIMVSNQINKLKEYRQALIYEAVTGKIDVRDVELD